MSRRKRKQNQRQPRQHHPRMASRNSQPQNPPQSGNKGPNEAHNTNADSNANKPQYAWVTVEHRDSDGNPTFPKDLIKSTYLRRYREVPPDTEVNVHVLAGYKPQPLMMVERKLYEVHRLSVQGWRRRGQIAVEMEGWRQHEADWFKAMRGVMLQISDPGLPNTPNQETDYVVSDSSFDRKIVYIEDEGGTKTEIPLHQGTLHITETWKSAWRRQRVGVLNLGTTLLLAPLLVALGAGLTLLWVDRSPLPSGNDSNTQETAAEHATHPSPDDLGSTPSENLVITQFPDVSASPSASDSQTSQASPKATQLGKDQIMMETRE